MNCPKCKRPMACKPHPEGQVGAGKRKGVDAPRSWYCKDCQKYLNEMKK